MSDSPMPGSHGEHELQLQHNTTQRAESFYKTQMLDHLNDRMAALVRSMDMMFISTADRSGACDCSIRCGSEGFVHILNNRTLVFPEYRGNGVMASLGNISENAHIGLLFVDFFKDCIGLHVNGSARILENAGMLELPDLPADLLRDAELRGGRRAERWVAVDVHEAYIHCAKHIPLLARLPKKIQWGTDDPQKKGGDYFAIAAERNNPFER